MDGLSPHPMAGWSSLLVPNSLAAATHTHTNTGTGTYPVRGRMTVRRMRTERRRARAAAYERRAAGAHVQRKSARNLLLLAQSLKDGHELGEVFVGFSVGVCVGGKNMHGMGRRKTSLDLGAVGALNRCARTVCEYRRAVANGRKRPKNGDGHFAVVSGGTNRMRRRR